MYGTADVLRLQLEDIGFMVIPNALMLKVVSLCRNERCRLLLFLR